MAWGYILQEGVICAVLSFLCGFGFSRGFVVSQSGCMEMVTAVFSWRRQILSFFLRKGVEAFDGGNP